MLQTIAGIDILFEKYFRKGFFLLASGSIFRSLYMNAEGIEYSTRFDNRFCSAITLGKEFNFKKGDNLSLGIRMIANGGVRYTPIDLNASISNNTTIVDETMPYVLGQSEEDVPFYYRVDARIAYRKDWPNFSLMISLDAQNLTDNKGNLFQNLYAYQSQASFERYHSGIFPFFLIQLDF